MTPGFSVTGGLFVDGVILAVGNILFLTWLEAGEKGRELPAKA